MRRDDIPKIRLISVPKHPQFFLAGDLVNVFLCTSPDTQDVGFDTFCVGGKHVVIDGLGADTSLTRVFTPFDSR